MATICLQVYWNYKNYLNNKVRLTNEIQIAYDKALENYFDETSKESFITVFANDSTTKIDDLILELKKKSDFEKILKKGKEAAKLPKKKVADLSIEFKEINDAKKTKTSFKTDSIKILKKVNEIKTADSIKKPTYSFAVKFENDSTKKSTHMINQNNKSENLEAADISYIPTSNKKSKITVLKGKKAIDSIGGIEQFPNKITMSFVNDTINYKKLDSIFKTELNRKNIVLTYEINHYKKDTLFTTYLKSKEKFSYQIKPNSTYLKSNETINLNYNFSNSLIVKRMGSELILSLLFSVAVIGCLYFLLFIIKRQKKVDEIKNDFINNITHEFKTPITTIATALEGMSIFNPENDLEKNKKYIAMSFNQLHKLENMVEKILETATLIANELQLNLEKINLVTFIQSIIEKHQEISKKEINFSFEKDAMFINADSFYLENAISNLIDNAIKYGGNKITIDIYNKDKLLFISVIDNGNSILKSQEKLIFEKFYRIPKGNIHDVKGYGIGLYYAKTIIEKHFGTIELSTINETIFTIKLPNEY